MGILLLDGKPVLTSPDGKLIEAPNGGGSSKPTEEIAPGDITFYDYEGTVVAAWSLSELSSKTALPDAPSHDGLVFQDWNWTLADLKDQNTQMNVGAMYTTTDGKTRIYVHLEESLTSPMIGLNVNGTVIVDWGDGSTPDTLTGTSIRTIEWTPVHNYESAGDYVITFAVNGQCAFTASGNGQRDSTRLLRYSKSSHGWNCAYANAIKKVHLGDNIVLENYAFSHCHSLTEISISSDTVMSKGYIFYFDMSLRYVTIPSGISAITSYEFYSCVSLLEISIPKSITKIGSGVFYMCYALKNAFLPNQITSIDASSFYYTASLSKLIIPAKVTTIDRYLCFNAWAIISIVCRGSISSIAANAFGNCYGMKFYDFSNCTAVPTLANTDAFINMANDCEIRVPAALLDKWKTAANWSTYANHIVAA